MDEDFNKRFIESLIEWETKMEKDNHPAQGLEQFDTEPKYTTRLRDAVAANIYSLLVSQGFIECNSEEFEPRYRARKAIEFAEVFMKVREEGC